MCLRGAKTAFILARTITEKQDVGVHIGLPILTSATLCLGKSVFASSLLTEGMTIQSPPGCQLAGVATFLYMVSCRESSTLSISLQQSAVGNRKHAGTVLQYDHDAEHIGVGQLIITDTDMSFGGYVRVED